MLEIENVINNAWTASLIFKSCFLGCVSDHFMLERTKFNKSKLDSKEKYYWTLNPIAFCLLKQYVSRMKNSFFCRPVDPFKKVHRLIIFVSEFIQCWHIISPNGLDEVELVSDSSYAYLMTNSTSLTGFLFQQIFILHLFYETA